MQFCATPSLRMEEIPGTDTPLCQWCPHPSTTCGAFLLLTGSLAVKSLFRPNGYTSQGDASRGPGACEWEFDAASPGEC